jgi:hypothetical protein
MGSGTFFFAVLLTGVAVEEDAGVDLEPHPFRVDCNDPVLVTLTLRSHYLLFLSTLWLDRSLRRGHFTRYYLTGWSPRVSARWCRRYPLFPTLSCAQAPFVSSLYVTLSLPCLLILSSQRPPVPPLLSLLGRPIS